MRKWFVPLTVLGLGGLGALFLSDRGRRAIGWISDRMEEAPERLAVWNESTELEVERIQSALNRLADSLGARPVRP
ncbi:MAG TPA: hypothetical protein VN622_13385 [Clostridia bacterium]|nr:hypothetical protein [Clostridia bacterium]